MVKDIDSPVKVLMAAIGGYGYYYLKTLFEEFSPGKVELAGVIDPEAQRSDHSKEITRLNIPVYSEIGDFYKNGNSADLAVISSPIHYHIPQSCTALKNGTKVLCDKPLGATVQDVDELIGTKNDTGNWVMTGYQWSYSEAIRNLKKDIINGLFGKPIRMKTLCMWGRDDAYYNRNNWAGRKRTDDGVWVLDSPVNNAMAHFLHNMFYILGPESGTSAVPVSVTAECCRANPIENFDTAACRIITEEKTELLFYGTHAAEADKGPVFHYEFEDAEIVFDGESGGITVVDKKGRMKSYGAPDDDHQFKKLFVAVENIGKDDPEIICGPEAARSQTLCINGIQESVQDITVFPEQIIQRDRDEKRYKVSELDSILINCYHNGSLPSETGIAWTQKGKEIDLGNYRYFPGGRPPV
ncbi:MAG: Gfo/Idh/MocA family oxidoreductase [bacterium]|nr:Gfo/Idh/MocA family oxidoreductase [bacterium]